MRGTKIRLIKLFNLRFVFYYFMISSNLQCLKKIVLLKIVQLVCIYVSDRDIEPGYRSVMQENALIVSLQMFNFILERCASLLPPPTAPVTAIRQLSDVAEDLQTLLPAIKVRFPIFYRGIK
jgi:hypothetical protein